MKNRRQSGQAIIELALALPILLAMVSIGYDLGNKAFLVHRLSQAAYEGVKLVSQVDDPIIDLCSAVPDEKKATTACLKCDKGNPGGHNCLSEAAITRATRALQESGINPVNKSGDPKAKFLEVSFDEITKNEIDGTYRYLFVKIDYNYRFVLLNITTASEPSIKVGTVYKKL